MINQKILHPNPIFKRDRWLNLNGEWDFSFDNPSYERKINVPFSWTSILSGINENKDGTAYYRKEVEYSFSSERLFLVIGACDYDTEVYVNGNMLAAHRGGYTPVKVDVTEVWSKEKPNTIEVKATDMSYEYQLYGKQGYGNSRGIWQTVYLEEAGQTYIEDFKITTSLNGEVTVRVKKGGDCVPCRLKAEFDGVVCETEGDRLKFTVDKPILWTQENPHLYYGTLSLETESGIDTVNTYFGIREVGTAKINGINYITLNGKPVYLNGLLDQSFNSDGHFTLPTDKDCEDEILRIKNAGFNLDRIHIKTEEPLKLYYADKHGVLLMQDIPCFWGEPDDTAKNQFEAEMEECMLRDINHPSIIYWVIFNETWGLKTFNPNNHAEWSYTKETQEWVRKCYKRAKELDPTRLVEDNSVCRMDHVETDVNTWHYYVNGYEAVKRETKRYADNHFEGSLFNFIGGNKCGDVPLMNSECGNYWGIDGNSGDSDISWQLKYMLNQLRLTEKNCGFVFTEFHDVENEFNGIYRIDNDLKKNGYDFYVDGMNYSDLTSQDFAAIDLPPMQRVNRGEQITVPVYISSFTDRNHGKTNILKFECTEIYADGSRKSVFADSEEVSYTYGLTKAHDFKFTVSDRNSIIVAAVTLVSDGEDVMKNFVLFHNNVNEAYCIPVTQLETEDFDYVSYRQNNSKLNCIGKGRIYTEVIKNQIYGYKSGSDLVLTLELSSKELLTKDKGIVSKSAIDLNYMRGSANDRGANRNSFYMTDSDKYPSDVQICVNGNVVADLKLEDCPADSTGSLSHFCQLSDRLLDEVGSYGYIHNITIPSDIIPGDTFLLEIKTDNSVSVFGRDSGAYPCGVNICVK